MSQSSNQVEAPQTSLDVLEQLRRQRADALSLSRDPSNEYRCFLGRHAQGEYRRLRARAMRPSPLPTDIAPRSALERAA